jgi:glycosyltransferase family protein
MPVVHNEWETVRVLIENKASISRFGDGELKLCYGKDQMCQPWNSSIQKKLRNILKKDVLNLLVGIPRIYNNASGIPPEKMRFWGKYRKKKYVNLYNPRKTYYSAFISRPDSVPEIDCFEYWAYCKKIWQDRKVLLFQGEDRHFEKSGGVFNNLCGFEIRYGPRRDAFSHYNKILRDLLKTPEDILIILSLGPTATMLAADLCKRGRQALDLGHFGMFYARTHPKSFGYNGAYYGIDKK